MNHGLYVFAFLVFAVFLFVSLIIHTDFKFYVLNFLENLLEKLDEIEDEENDKK